jgi:hypothetical protein
VLTVTEVARRTGRTHQAVSAAVQRGQSLEEVLARPKGQPRAGAKLAGRRGRFSAEGNTSAIILELGALGVSRARLTARAARLGSLRAAVLAVQFEILTPTLLEGLGAPERMPGVHCPSCFVRPQVAEIRHDPKIPAGATRAG